MKKKKKYTIGDYALWWHQNGGHFNVKLYLAVSKAKSQLSC